MKPQIIMPQTSKGSKNSQKHPKTYGKQLIMAMDVAFFDIACILSNYFIGGTIQIQSGKQMQVGDTRVNYPLSPFFIANNLLKSII